MTEYKENVWYGWNGGECPVHHETEVEYIYLDDSIGPCLCQDKAGHFIWNGDDPMPLIAFRVVKEYKEPREFFIVGSLAIVSEEYAKVCMDNTGIKGIKVREVLEN